MTEAEYRSLFSELDIAAREIGHTLRWKREPKRCYFNRNRVVGIYFSAHPDDDALYPVRLWERIGSWQVKRKDRGRLNVRPLPGKELAAFRALAQEWDY